MTKTYLKSAYRNQFLGKDNSTNIFKLAQQASRTSGTIEVWARGNNPILATPLILSAISQILGVPEKKLVETINDEVHLHE